MYKYLSILRLGWLDAIEYRTEFFVSILGWGIRLFISVFLWMAVAETRGGSIGAYSARDILAYFFIVQILSSFIFLRVGFDIAHDIYRGDFANYLVKPMNYLVFRLTRELSKNAFRTVLSLMLFGILLFAFLGGIPFSAIKVPLALAATIGGYLINFFIICLIALSAFWIINSSRLMFIYFGILTIFSGMIFPIDLFPTKLQEIFSVLPFPYIFFFPAKVIQTPLINTLLLHDLGIQWIFVVLLGLIVTMIYRIGVKRFEGVGR